jgi:intracellular sulfur oxidation DsrE/DsrF family protein
MKYKLLSILFGLMATFTASAQTAEVDNTPYKIVIQLTSGDTAVHRGLIKQINNALTAAPKSRIEVVCHNNGLFFLVSAKTYQSEAIQKLKTKGVAFMACENSMRSHKVKREELLPEANTVPSGVIEIVKKQGKRWAYLKAG